MSQQIIECVVNVSEGRNEALLSLIQSSINQIEAVQVLHRDSGWDAHRTVFTIAGAKESVFKAIEKLYELVSVNVDMQAYDGVHPAIGAVDVVPFVPLQNITINELKIDVQRWAKKIGEKYQLPIFYYGSMATTNQQYTLSYLRKGGFQMIKESLAGNELTVNEGSYEYHKKLGASCWTTREIMIAYNVNLNTNDLEIAKKIAKKIRNQRKASLQMQDLKVLAWHMDEYNCCQISTNIYDTEAMTIEEVFLLIKETANYYNVDTKGSEIIGMAPLRALSRQINQKNITNFIQLLGLNSVSDFDPTQRILENAMEH